MKPTKEQKIVFNHIEKGHNLKVLALAGVGKTTTLFMAFKREPKKKFLLLAFNSHLAVEYKKKIKKMRLGNVDSMTLHKLAKTYTIDRDEFVVNGKTFGKTNFKLIPFIHGKALKDIVGYGSPSGWNLSTELKKFCSSDMTFDEAEPYIWTIFDYCLEDGEITHDMYMKMFQLNIHEGILNLDYDCVVIDEFQDMSESVANIFIRLKVKQKIAVGDKYQALYDFILKGFEFDKLSWGKKEPKIAYLTKSFRCSHEIASKVNETLMRKYMHTEVDYVGAGTDKEDKSR